MLGRPRMSCRHHTRTRRRLHDGCRHGAGASQTDGPDPSLITTTANCVAAVVFGVDAPEIGYNMGAMLIRRLEGNDYEATWIRWTRGGNLRPCFLRRTGKRRVLDPRANE